MRTAIIFTMVLSIGLGAVAQEDHVSLSYDPATGHMSIDTVFSGIDTITVTSASGLFTGDIVPGIYNQRLHLLRLFLGEQFGNTRDLGQLTQPGLTTEFLLGDLCVDRGSGFPISASIGNTFFPTRTEACPVVPDPDRPTGPADRTAVFHYDQSNGNMSVELGENARLTTLEIQSRSGMFTGDPAQNLASVFDVDSDHTIFKLWSEGFDDIDFGNVLQPGLSNNEFVSDLCVDGSWLEGGRVEAEFQFTNSTRVPMDGAFGICNGFQPPANLNVSYNPDVGYFVVSVEDLPQRDGSEFITLDIKSESGIFVGVPANLGGPDDIYSSNRVLKHDPEGFSELVLGNVIQPGLTLDFILNDLTFDAITNDNRVLGEITAEEVPEPNGSSILLIGLVAFVSARRRFR